MKAEAEAGRRAERTRLNKLSNWNTKEQSGDRLIPLEKNNAKKVNVPNKSGTERDDSVEETMWRRAAEEAGLESCAGEWVNLQVWETEVRSGKQQEGNSSAQAIRNSTDRIPTSPIINRRFNAFNCEPSIRVQEVDLQ